jgi:hypothetical protein
VFRNDPERYSRYRGDVANPPPQAHWVSGDLPADDPFEGPITCSFCGRPQSEQRPVVAGPTPAVAICEDCVILIAEMFAEMRADSHPE